MDPCVDVVVVAYDSAALLASALAPVTGNDLVASVTVVDHGSDGSADVAESLGALAIRNPENPGFGAGQNRGIAAGSSPFVLLLNPDAVIEPGALDRGVAHLTAHTRIAAVQGVVRDRTTGAVERSQGDALSPVHLAGRALAARRLLRIDAVRRLAARSAVLADSAERVPSEVREVEALAATAILARRAALDSVAGFDPRYFLYGEDMDLSLRLRRAGWTLVALPVAWATHVGGASSEPGVDRELRWWRGTLRYAAQWWSRTRWLVATLAAFVMCSRLVLRAPRRAPEIARELLVCPQRVRRDLTRFRASAGGPPSPTRSSPGPP
jgi:GT2 family glycosyltransferase